jgi:hypothetical protein
MPYFIPTVMSPVRNSVPEILVVGSDFKRTFIPSSLTLERSCSSQPRKNRGAKSGHCPWDEKCPPGALETN